jgi:hypothetical protein
VRAVRLPRGKDAQVQSWQAEPHVDSTVRGPGHR